MDIDEAHDIHWALLASKLVWALWRKEKIY
jgi:hypothetical protein